MATISTLQSKNQFTQDLIDVVNISKGATGFLLNKFAPAYKPTLYLTWQSRRWSEIVASSIVRGQNGNRIKAQGFTQKVELPPFFHLYFNIMDLDGYNAAFGTQNPAESAIDDLMEQAAFMFGVMKDMVNRRLELMASQVYQTGIILDSTTGNIDFGRNPASIVDLSAGNYWDNAAVSPFDILESAGIYLRQYGKISGNTIDIKMGASAYRQFLKSTIVLSRAQKLWNELTSLTMPDLKEDGSVFMGQVSAGPYLCNIYTYPEYYTASTEYQQSVTVQTIAGQTTSAASVNTSTPYINDANIIATPTKGMVGKAGFAMVPKLPKQVSPSDGDFGDMGEVEGGKFFAYDYQDVKLTSWEMNLKCAGMPILTNPDSVFTAKVMPS